MTVPGGVLVLSHGFWQRHFDGDPEVLGREFEMAEQRWRIVGGGVADPEFRSGLALAFWGPLSSLYSRTAGWHVACKLPMTFHSCRVFARRASRRQSGRCRSRIGWTDPMSSPVR